jgi:uroporphyrinogen-III synthase
MGGQAMIAHSNGSAGHVTPRPLRIAVTRDEGPDGPLASALRRRGLTPVCCAVVRESESPEPERLARAARELDRYDWLVVASARAVAAMMAARGAGPLPGGLRSAAVGPATAEALVACGAQAPLTAQQAGAAALVDALRDADAWPGRRVLLPRAANGGPELGEALRHWGAIVDEIAAYGTLERPRQEILASWRAAAADAVVVASPSAAYALVHAVGVADMRRLEPVIAIGPTTAMALVGQGVAAVVPPRSDFESLAEFVSEIAPRAAHAQANGNDAANGGAPPARDGGAS